MSAIDLDDTSACCEPTTCRTCGSSTDVRVVTVTLGPLGVACLAVCDPCIEDGRLPKLSCPAAACAVADHCGHLGVTLEEMAAELDREVKYDVHLH